VIEAQGLTKRYGEKLAVDDLTFTVRPGVVTGFLGPNGAGKSTTIRPAAVPITICSPWPPRLAFPGGGSMR
jgi:ABC-type multidrug transport system ATPase subunit